MSMEMDFMEERSAVMRNTEDMKCSYTSFLIGYGPLVVSLVNSFLSLVIDNYMHYQMIAEVKTNEDESSVRDFGRTSRTIKYLFSFWKKYFTFITVAIQWILPFLVTVSMYSMDVKEKNIFMGDLRSFKDTCMALLDVSTENCTMIKFNETLQLRTHLSKENYLEMYENYPNSTGDRFDSIVDNVYKIIANLQNATHADVNKTSLFRLGKADFNKNCMKICYLDNKVLLLYMFAVTIVSYFVPITISTVILTKIHVMEVKRQNVKTYVSRELLYNILFWSPIMFDTFLSLTLCSYTMNGMRNSIFNIIANLYQAIKNFMNTKYFKDNAVSPI